jgi:hypothetical protein
LFIGGISWVILSLVGALVPQYHGKLFAWGQSIFLGEVALMLWLLIKGSPDVVNDVLSTA